MSEFSHNQDFRDLLVALSDEGARFLLIGGWALALHGHGRGTDDMDIFVEPNEENANKVFRALAAFGAPVAAHGITAGLFAQEGYGYRIGTKPNLIEILTCIDGINFNEACVDSQTFELEGRTVPYIGRDAPEPPGSSSPARPSRKPSNSSRRTSLIMVRASLLHSTQYALSTLACRIATRLTSGSGISGRSN